MNPPSPHLLLLLSLTLSFTTPHPLDPLTPSEISAVRRIIISSSSLPPSSSHTFHYVSLQDPDKPAFLQWHSNPTTHPLPPRIAFVILRSSHQTHELQIDIPTNRIISHRIRSGHGQPMLNMEEQNYATNLPFNHAPFVDSVKKRGLKLRDVVCSTFTVGWHGEREGRRLIKLQCFVGGETANVYMRPIEGVTMVADLEAGEIVGYEDRMVVEVPRAEGTEYRAGMVGPPFGPRGRLVVLEQPEGKGFVVEGSMVRLLISSCFAI